MNKIIFITGSLSPIKCGISFYSAKLIEELNKIGIKTSVITSFGSSDRDDIVLKTDWRIFDIPKILKVIKESDIDTIHIQYPAVGYGRRLGINLLPWVIRLSLPKKRIVFTLHEYHASKAIRVLGKIRNIITVLPAHKIAVSNNVDSSKLSRFLGKKVVVIPIGSNMGIPVKPNFKRDPKGIVYFGYPHKSKNLEILLDAMVLLPDYHLRLFSRFDNNDPCHKSLLDKAKKLLNISTEADTSDEAILDALTKATFFVLPQDQPLTAKSSTAITAACCGVIVIAKASDHPVDQIPYISNKNCILLKDLTPQSIAKAINDTEPESANKLSEESLKLLNYFDWENIVNRYSDIYTSFQKQ